MMAPHLSQLTSHESAQWILSKDGPLRAISIPFPLFLCMNGRLGEWNCLAPVVGVPCSYEYVCVALALGRKDESTGVRREGEQAKAFLSFTSPDSRPPSPSVRTNYASSHRGRPVLSVVGEGPV